MLRRVIVAQSETCKHHLNVLKITFCHNLSNFGLILEFLITLYVISPKLIFTDNQATSQVEANEIRSQELFCSVVSELREQL